jgi:hypothetical protein
MRFENFNKFKKCKNKVKTTDPPSETLPNLFWFLPFLNRFKFVRYKNSSPSVRRIFHSMLWLRTQFHPTSAISQTFGIHSHLQLLQLAYSPQLWNDYKKAPHHPSILLSYSQSLHIRMSRRDARTCYSSKYCGSMGRIVAPWYEAPLRCRMSRSTAQQPGACRSTNWRRSRDATLATSLAPASETHACCAAMFVANRPSRACWGSRAGQCVHSLKI